MPWCRLSPHPAPRPPNSGTREKVRTGERRPTGVRNTSRIESWLLAPSKYTPPGGALQCRFLSPFVVVAAVQRRPVGAALHVVDAGRGLRVVLFPGVLGVDDFPGFAGTGDRVDRDLAHVPVGDQ